MEMQAFVPYAIHISWARVTWPAGNTLGPPGNPPGPTGNLMGPAGNPLGSLYAL
jgi:hypothetical protein